MRRLLMILGLALGSAGLGAWTPDHWFDRPRSTRIANYRIEAALDWKEKVLTGREALSWRNTGAAATGEFPLHLYLNAFKGPQTLFFKDVDRTPDPGAARPEHWGYCRILGAQLDGQPLEGHFGEDETVWWVRLPRLVAPGETISLDIDWESRFPLVSDRTGWNRDFLMGAQWFPQAGVYEGDRWHCRAYHSGTGFFSDFGTYDVALSLPATLLLAHTGTLTNLKSPEDTTPDPERPANVLWKLHAEDVHDFAWAVMPRRNWNYRSFDYRGVRVLSFFQPASSGAYARQALAAQSALKHAGEWLFPYPYPVLTIVGVPEGAEGADRTEYPTLVTAGCRPFDPLRRRTQPEEATIHEVGHQWFYGMLAANAAEEPWLDEGFATWFTEKAMERTYQNLFSSRRFLVATDTPGVAGYWRDPSVDPLDRPGFLARDLDSGIAAARFKAPLVLDQLEAMLGRPMMEQVIQGYAREMAFRHPTGRDLERIAGQVSGRDLSGFWRDFVEGTDTLDVVIQKVGTREVLEGGWMDSPQGPVFAAPQPAAPGRTGSLTLLRRGGLRYPITLWVRLENHTEQRLTWDGQDRWVTYPFDSPVAVAILDPDGNYPMLKDRLHASYSAQPARRGLHYWAQMVCGAIAGLLQAAGIG